ncbi:hypothetical protein FBZ99_1121, partial [Rhizobium sp. ERR 1071]
MSAMNSPLLSALTGSQSAFFQNFCFARFGIK